MRKRTFDGTLCYTTLTDNGYECRRVMHSVPGALSILRTTAIGHRSTEVVGFVGLCMTGLCLVLLGTPSAGIIL